MQRGMGLAQRSQFLDQAVLQHAIKAVGDGLMAQPAVAARMLRSLEGVPLRMVSQAASRRNVTVVIADADVPEAMRGELFRYWCESPLPVIADASGLAWLPRGAVADGALRVITPHPGEAARLWKNPKASLLADRPLAAARIGG